MSRAPRSRRGALAALATLGYAALRPSRIRASPDEAASWPDRPLRLIVGSAPGGGDIVPRLFATKLAEALRQPVVVENRPGASYNIASDIVARAAPDGYTLLWATSQITLTPTLLGRSVVVDPVTALAPITKVLATPVIVFVQRSLGVTTLRELLDLAARGGGRIDFATTGSGTLPHLVMETLARRAGVAMQMIPYSNAGQALADFIQGQVRVFPTFYVGMKSHLASGNVLALAVASARRTGSMPDVPSVAELGFPQAAVEPWAGFAAPAGTPGAIVGRLHREIVRIVASPDMAVQYAQLGMDPVVSTPASFAADLREQVEAWPAIVKAAGISIPK